MGKVSPIQSSFLGGEISPLCYGIVENPRYKQSLKVCQNYIPVLQGPKTRRPGSKFVFTTRSQSKKSRLIPFEISSEETYVVEIGEGYLRFYIDNALLTTGTTKSITGITKANPAVVTSNSHGYSNGDRVILSGITGMTELNNREFIVANVATNTYELSGVNSSSYTTYISGGSSVQPREILYITNVFGSTNQPFPYLENELNEIQFTRSNEALYLSHPNHPTAKITLDGNPFAFQEVAFENGPYIPQGATALGLTATLTSGVINGSGQLPITANNTNGINNGSGFLSTDIGRSLALKASSVWYWGVIDSVSSTTSITIKATVFPSALMPNSTAASNWQLGAWSYTTGFPRAIEFHEDRLVLGGYEGEPGRFDGSNTGDYENFSPFDTAGTIAANNAYSFILNSKDLNSIQWITSDEQGMLIGTSGSEWIVSAADSQSALSATSIKAVKTTSVGSAGIQAVQSGKNSIFVQNGGKKVRELNYYFDVNGFRCGDLLQLAEHLTRSPITAIAVQKIPQPIVWALRDDGRLLAMTYERDVEVLKVGWSKHILGEAESANGSAVVESICVVRTADGISEELWMTVKRTIQGQDARYVEYLTQFYDDSMELSDAVFGDSAVFYDGSSTTVVSGINHLNGQIVGILADGSPKANQTVTAGKILLDAPASKIVIGVTYNSDGQKLRNEAGASDGTSMGKTRRTHRLGVMLLNTLGFMMGPDFDSLDEIILDEVDDLRYDSAQPLFSGIMTRNVTTDYDFDSTICWRQNQMLPGTVQGLYPQMVTQDRG